MGLGHPVIKGQVGKDRIAVSAEDEATHSETTVLQFQRASLWPPLGKMVIVQEAAGLSQAVVLQCSLVTLKHSPKKSRVEEQSKNSWPGPWVGLPPRWGGWTDSL